MVLNDTLHWLSQSHLGEGRRGEVLLPWCVSVMRLALNVSGLLLSLEGHVSRSGMWPALQVINMV